jgi:hypothetical protein
VKKDTASEAAEEMKIAQTLDALATTFTDKLAQADVIIAALHGFQLRHMHQPELDVDYMETWVRNGFEQGVATMVKVADVVANK